MFDYKSKAWHYDEFTQIGVDFETLEEVEEYDEGIGKGINIYDDVQGTRDVLGDKPADATAINCKEEYPMCLCSIEAILKKVGFDIEKITIHTGYLATLVCSKN